jgi:hypothetical protein
MGEEGVFGRRGKIQLSKCWLSTLRLFTIYYLNFSNNFEKIAKIQILETKYYIRK